MTATQKEIYKLLQPLFFDYKVKMQPAKENQLKTFRDRCFYWQINEKVVQELEEFYTVANGVPCLDSLDIFPCEDITLFEWWEENKELWLGKRDFYVFRYHQRKFLMGDVGNPSFSKEYEFDSFFLLLQKVIQMYK